MACAALASCSNDPNIPLSREDPTYDAPTVIDGMGWGVGVFAGVLVTPLPWLRLGGSFHSGAGTVSIPVDLSVDLPQAVTDYLSTNLPTVSLPAIEAEGKVETVSPMIVTAGIAADVTSKLELAADLHWIDYSSTTVMKGIVSKPDPLGLIGAQVLVKGRRDSFLVGLRGAYRILPSLRAALRLEYENNSRPEEWTSPISIDFTKYSFHLGVAWQMTRNVAVSLEYGHFFMPDRNIKRSNFAPNADATTPEEQGVDKPSPTGRYWIDVDRVGLGIALGF
jgi:long-subunit fatty acid transport protein